ncbi:hypothetical protein ACVWYG_000983 [Pedobacter sp. UYEF25]
MIKYVVTFCFLLVPYILLAQSKAAHAGWFTLTNNVKLTERLSGFTDVQLRTSDHLSFLKQVEVNAGINYNFLTNQEIGFGGVFASTRQSQLVHLKEDDRRVFEQYLLKQNLWSAGITHRFRLEQRFIEPTSNHDFFTQRLRYRFKAQQPLSSRQVKFTNGCYAVVQDEVFVNVQNKDKLNNHFFDQNRWLLGIGYRISKGLDVDLSYLNTFVVGTESDKYTHILQLALNSKF